MLSFFIFTDTFIFESFVNTLLLKFKQEYINFEFIKDWAIKHPDVKLGTTNEEIITNPVVIKRIQDEIEHYNERFGNWEKVKRFELTPDVWSINDGHLTPTMKLKRKIIKEKYNNLYVKIYGEQ